MSEGGALASEEIRKRLDRGEIFRPGSWDPNHLRAAAYDLRIADDFLVVPDPEFPGGRRYNRGEKRREPIILQPGDVAFVSTMERLSVPWDLTAHIGIKFGSARRGILVLTGLLVDPGFGLAKMSDGRWVPKEDERLHLLLANVGPNSVVLSPGQTIASIQFFKISGTPMMVEVASRQDMEREFFDPQTKPKAGLVFFREMADLRSRVEGFHHRISAVEAGSNQVVMFGVYLLSATLLVGAVATILSLISSGNLVGKIQNFLQILPTNWPGALVLSLGLVALAWITHALLNFVATLIARRVWRAQPRG